MNIEKLIKKIEAERARSGEEIYNEEGLLRLEEVLRAYEGEYKLVSWEDLTKRVKDRKETQAHKSRLEKFDEITRGFREQQLIIVTGHTKHGKTSFCSFLAKRFEELCPVFIALEQSAEEIIAFRLSEGYSIPRLFSPDRTAPSPTVEWIEHRIVEGIAKYDTRMVVIDHLGFIDSFGENRKYARENLAERIAMTVRELKNIAKRWNVIIVLAVHISQNDETKLPALHDIKNSSSIAQEADKVIMVWRENTKDKHGQPEYTNKVVLSVQANRQRGNGNVKVVFDEKTGDYCETEEEMVYEEEARRQRESEDDFNKFDEYAYK